ncbi:MAG: ABC transporter permease [Micromonosporaceae bacterium]|nr:ABC transporter permease [Micromonosporaceae bacterium]
MLRATLKSLLSRKLRLVLSGMAVVLGAMFVSGAFVLTDTIGRSFDSLFSNAYANVDVQVTGHEVTEGQQATVPASVADQITAVPGVAGQPTPQVLVDGARVIGHDGKAVTTFGAPRYGRDWAGEKDQVQLREGHGPQADNEIAVNAGLAKTANLHVGDQVPVLTVFEPKKTYKLVGIFGRPGGRDSLGGETEVDFTTPVAQRVMLGQTGVYSDINVKAAAGVPDDALRARIATALGSSYQVKTGKQLADENKSSIQSGLSFFNDILLGFAAVALFVGTFLILNTFSIIVAQRTRELAMMRSLGSSRRQVIGSVMIEALLIGVVASLVGLGLGIGVGAVLAALFGGFVGGLQLAGIAVPLSAVIGALAVGIGITMLAALMPAIRASRIPPVAALQEVATADRPLTRVTVSGAVTTAIGVGLLGWGLFGRAGSGTLWLVLAGVLVSFIGVALLTPLVARPVVALIGSLFAWSVPGKLGRINSGRNPRRTAITAAALMVGLALITGFNVVVSSVSASLHHLGDTQVKADLIISGQQSAELPPTFDPAVLEKSKQLPGVREVAGGYLDIGKVNGKAEGIAAVSDLPALADMFPLTAKEGTLAALGDNQAVLDEDEAKTLGLHAGSTVTIQLSRGQPHTVKVVGIYAKNDVFNGWMVATNLIPDFRVPQPAQAFIRLQNQSDLAAVKASVARLLADSPEVNVTDRSGFIDQQVSQLNSVLTFIQILLALAILIAILGIVNTLALSVLERTRELGLLRAIGLRRAQAMRMVTVEAVVISIFGALLGLIVGSGLGVAVVRALRDQGFTNVALPWNQMVVYLVLAGVVGVVAAILPSVRAARINVLEAIAYE